MISWTAKLRVLAEPLVAAGTSEDESIAAFAARRVGRQAADALVDPMVSGIYAGDAARLSMRAAFPTIWELERNHGSLVKGLWAKRRRRSEGSSRAAGLISFPDGIAALPNALARSLGDRIRTSHRVTGLRRLAPADAAPARWRLSLGTGPDVDADHVVIAGHPAIAARLTGVLDAEIGALLESIPSAPVAVVALGYPRASIDHPLDGFGFLVPRREGLRTLGVLWESSIFPGRAPDNYVLLRAIIGGAHDPAAVTLADEELLAVAAGDLRRTLGITSPPAFTHIVRHHTGIPQCTLGHAARLARLDDCLGRWPGLHLTGWGYRGVSVNHSIADAARVATTILTRST